MYKRMLKLKRTGIILGNMKRMKSDAKQKYTETILLPQTDFPIRLKREKRIERDKYLMKKCGFSELYEWQRKHLSGPDYVLHDGPPYANGEPHMGHAINKILKDITLRSKVINGQRVHYVPGWDCHGLPIEIKVISNSRSLSPLEIRHKAREYAKEAVKQQKNAFETWGILADWKTSGCYFTNEVSYIKNELQQFGKFYEKGLVFRDFKPVHWSPSSRTALAESELEYNAFHKSKSVTLRLKVSNLPSILDSLGNRNIYALTWTTTPWTLVANQALAFNADALYSVVEDDNKNLYILAKDLVESVQSKIGSLVPVTVIKGHELTGAKYLHPITGESLPFLPGKHVTTSLGTGLVHTAPAHGPEDFCVALENNISVLSMVDEEGKYTESAGQEFYGLEVLQDGTEKILNHVTQKGLALHTETLVHSYPYDWRTKKPIIIRASNQWFIDINSIKHQAVECVSNVNIYPKDKSDMFRDVLLTQIKQRPYWCISRQRSWGTPIPALHWKSKKKSFVSRKWIDELCNLIDRNGVDCWWQLPVEELISQQILNEINASPEDLEKGTDILDIWFDSGISWSSVLPEGKADLYLEGVDQFTGWFQSSLLTSVALQGKAPYSTLFVHGFAVDEKANKMSKSIGNVINPEDIINGGSNLTKQPAYGIDTLRWWVAAHGCQHSQVPVTTELLRDASESVQRLRAILRFVLGALYPYVADPVIEPRYTYLDRYMLHRLYSYNNQIRSLYNDHRYNLVCQATMNFVANDVSSVYCHLVKDRLYCEESASPSRFAAVEVINAILTVLVRNIAPIVPHLAEEVWLYHPENIDSTPLYHSQYTIPENWNQPDVLEYVQAALHLKSNVNKLIKKNTWQIKVAVEAPKKDYALLSVLQNEKSSSTSELCDILQVSAVDLTENNSLTETRIDLSDLERPLCARCRRYPKMEEELCERCVKVLNTKLQTSVVV